MDEPLRSHTSTIDIYIKLAQYPILADTIRDKMREEMFRRGIISREEFDSEVQQKAVESQKREGVYDPFGREPTAIWQERKAKIRDFQTDFYFSINLPTSVFEQLVSDVLHDQPGTAQDLELSFNPELAPWDMLFQQGVIYEEMPPLDLEKYRHHLEEIKAVLIKGMVSDQLPYIGLARKVFDIADLRHIHGHRIGRGKIGGKAAGMLLAWKILQKKDPEIGGDISNLIAIPESYFIGTEVIYDFRLLNGLDYLMNQKYRPLNEIRAQYPKIVRAHLNGRFPQKIYLQLRDLLLEIGDRPLIVRSSSLLEDNFGFSFAGKYDSYFCPNQGSPDENLEVLLNSIKRIYASTLSPDAILYRSKNQLIDYDERMAILLQVVQGDQVGKYFLPSLAGVGFSQNTIRWSPKIRREDGFLRVVWGLGTRAVDRVANDYTRLIALSHPQLKPANTAKAIRQYSQHYVDLIDLEENKFKTLPVQPLLKALVDEGCRDLRFIISIDEGDYIRDLVALGNISANANLLVTFDTLVKDRKFVKLMRSILLRLERGYGRPIDFEFTIHFDEDYPNTNYCLTILQCRPLSMRVNEELVHIPENIPSENVLFTSFELVPNGRVEGIRYVLFVDPRKYRQIPDAAVKSRIGQAVGSLNKTLEHSQFVLMGPGRWGSSNIDLGVQVSYADIYNTRALIEMAVASHGIAPSLSYGTHFYQDLVEAGIFALPLHLEDTRSSFNWEFFDNATSALGRLAPSFLDLDAYLKLIDLEQAAGGRRLTIVMDGSRDETVGFLAEGDWEKEEDISGTLSAF
ncbi:MAG: PEP/pyruvate-binding domain-containing protein [Candidatus Promineifilaceae bacterium]